jgi:hypothetical protein
MTLQKRSHQLKDLDSEQQDEELLLAIAMSNSLEEDPIEGTSCVRAKLTLMSLAEKMKPPAKKTASVKQEPET